MREHDQDRPLDLPEAPSAQRFAERLSLQRRLLNHQPVEEPLSQWLAVETSPSGLQELLAELAYFGQGQLAADAAGRIESALPAGALSQELAYALEQHQVFAAIERFWRSERGPADAEAFEQALQRAGLEDPEDLAVLTGFRDAGSAAQLTVLKQSLRERHLDAALLPAQLAFGQDSPRLGLFTAAAIVEQAFALWEMVPVKGRPEFDHWLKLATADFESHCLELAEEAPDDAFVLLWGLPPLCDWLVGQGLINPLTRRHLLNAVSAMREPVCAVQGELLWTYGFVLGWPQPDGLPDLAAAFAPPPEDMG